MSTSTFSLFLMMDQVSLDLESKYIVGKNTLAQLIPEMCKAAGMQGHKTGHSGKVTCATTLYHQNFSNQLIEEQCVKLLLARSPMASMYCHLATYFLFLSTILGNKVSGWLGCAVHGMRDINT